jgi:hypothetical protein
LGDRSKSLGFEKIDACTFGAEIGFQANEDERRVRAEMKDFRIPLNIVSYDYLWKNWR